MSRKDEKRIHTRLVEAGRRKEWTGRLVNPPVHRASTILYDTVADLDKAKPVRHGVWHYGRSGTPTTWSLEEALTELEPGAAGTMLYPSGIAAIAAALFSVLKAGDELLMVDSVYYPTRTFCDEVLARFGIRTRYYDPLIGRGIAELMGEDTRAIFMESPGSLTFEVQDVPGICALARDRGVVTVLDNTWATPIFFQAMAAGADLSILACTKYVVGHSDVMMGSVTAAPGAWKALDRMSRAMGQCASPDDAYLAARGLRTLGVRLAQHQENALKVARWLKKQPQVAKVIHPAFEDCPGHEYWKRDFAGASGLFAFVLKGGGNEDRASFIDNLVHFGIGYSWGGYESLALPIDPRPLRSVRRVEEEGPMVRLHIGLEDPEDLIEDLAAGLSAYGAGR